MHNPNFIIARDGSSYSKLYYRLEGNLLQVRYIDHDDDLTPLYRWKDVRTIEL
jgi:hypothetical protein